MMMSLWVLCFMSFSSHFRIFCRRKFGRSMGIAFENHKISPNGSSPFSSIFWHSIWSFIKLSERKVRYDLHWKWAQKYKFSSYKVYRTSGSQIVQKLPSPILNCRETLKNSNKKLSSGQFNKIKYFCRRSDQIKAESYAKNIRQSI